MDYRLVAATPSWWHGEQWWGAETSAKFVLDE
jgi:hypothetical protein